MDRRSRLAGLCVLLLCARAAWAGPLRPNVVLVVVDALRPDRLGAYGSPRNASPRVDALARRGTLFDQAIAQAPWTVPSLSSIMTSLYPSVHGAVRPTTEPDWPKKLERGELRPAEGEKLGEGWPTLAEALKGAGYRTGAAVSGGYCRSAFGFGRGFEDYSNEGGSFAELNRTVSAWLRRGDGRPFFLYVHVNDVHDPYDRQPGLARLWDDDYAGSFDGSWAALWQVNEGRRAFGARDLVHLAALYDSGVAFMDDQMGSLLDGLDALGLSTSTVVVVTADHGEGFYEHGLLVHGNSLFDELLKIPLIIAGPGVPQGRRVAAQVRSIDIAPTVLRLAGAPPQPGMQGIDLAPWMDGRRTDDLEAFSELGSAATLRAPPWKRVFDSGRQALFDLSADPGERADLSAARPSQLRRMADRAAAWRRGNDERRGLARPDPGDVRARLRAAGYVP